MIMMEIILNFLYFFQYFVFKKILVFLFKRKFNCLIYVHKDNIPKGKEIEKSSQIRK